jgi:hypothetical protein
VGLITHPNQGKILICLIALLPARAFCLTTLHAVPLLLNISVETDLA